MILSELVSPAPGSDIDCWEVHSPSLTVSSPQWLWWVEEVEEVHQCSPSTPVFPGHDNQENILTNTTAISSFTQTYFDILKSYGHYDFYYAVWTRHGGKIEEINLNKSLIFQNNYNCWVREWTWGLTDLTGQLTCNWYKMNYLLDSYWYSWYWSISIIQHNTYIVTELGDTRRKESQSTNSNLTYSQYWNLST